MLFSEPEEVVTGQMTCVLLRGSRRGGRLDQVPGRVPRPGPGSPGTSTAGPETPSDMELAYAAYARHMRAYAYLVYSQD